MQLALMIFLAMFFLVACGGEEGGPSESSTSTATGESPRAEATTTPVPASATVGPLVIGDDDRLRIPKIGVDTPLTLSVLSQEGRLDNPADGNSVVAYDMSAAKALPTPVMYDVGGTPLQGTLPIYGYLSRQEQPRAVFYDLPTLVRGDTIEVVWQGRTYQYTVASKCYRRPFNPGEDAAAIYRSTPAPTLLLHAHVGRWPSSDSNRPFTYGMVFIRAEQQSGTVSGQCPTEESPEPPTGLGGDEFGR